MHPKAIAGDMNHIILAMSPFYLYLMFVVVLLITALWTRESDPPASKRRAADLTIARGVGDTRVAVLCNLDQLPSRSSAWRPQRGRHPFGDLEARVSASYAARLEQTIRTIRVAPRAGARPTDQAAG